MKASCMAQQLLLEHTKQFPERVPEFAIEAELPCALWDLGSPGFGSMHC